MQTLADEVLTAPVQKGQAVSTTELTASTAAISIPQGLDAMTVTISGARESRWLPAAGKQVDIYANITKVSIGGSNAGGVSASLPIPCTELAMTNIDVMDVSSTSPSLAATGSTGSSRRKQLDRLARTHRPGV